MYTKVEDLSPSDRVLFGVIVKAHLLEIIGALELIAAGPRPDGTWNRDRQACQQLALDALAKLKD